jgi:cytoskeletal protein CcmA (bactofilin family)
MRNTHERSHHGPTTIIGTTVTLIGTLRDQNDITIHGTVEGEIHSEQTVTIGEQAIIKGPISADTIVVGGTVRGELAATSHIEILSTGKVYGSTNTADLAIRSGAVFIGKSSMPENKSEPVTTDDTEATYEVE